MTRQLLLTLTEKVDPTHTALVVIDIQNDFCATEGFYGRAGADVSFYQAMVPRLINLIGEARQAGVPIVFVRNILGEQHLSEPMLERLARLQLKGEYCIDSTWGADFYLVRPEPQDLLIDKHRYSAFMGTDLHQQLQARGIRSLLVTGVATQVCVESTARDGYQLGYYIVLVEDCCASTRPELHATTLENITRSFGVVCPASAVSDAWRPGASERPAFERRVARL